MEKDRPQRHHEVVRPLVEVAQQVGHWVLEKIVPSQAVEIPQDPQQ